MRLIYSTHDEKLANRLTDYLNRKGIGNHIEISINTDWGSDEYGDRNYIVWVIDEDQFAEGNQIAEQFSEAPSDTQFNPEPVREIQAFPKEQPNTHQYIRQPVLEEPPTYLTWYVLFACTFLFLFGAFNIQTPSKEAKELPYAFLVSSPVKRTFMYDFPKAFSYLEQAVALYQNDGEVSRGMLDREREALEQKFTETPKWEGIYAMIIAEVHGKDATTEKAPLFEKIGEGQIWRLFTPCLLHYDIFHLVFNMIWLIVLGNQIEAKIEPKRYLYLMLILAAFSNTAQYLMSGPAFLGFSGVIAGLFTYIWARQIVAPWEGYQLQKATRTFLAFSILAMFCIQLAAFGIEVVYGKTFNVPIANTAHLAGGFLGFALGRFPYFKRG